MIKLTTNFGNISIELDYEKAPLTTKNFEDYIRAGHYDNTIFHRVIDGFMIQGGGFTDKMIQKPCNDPIKNEADNGLKNEEYTVAMARTNQPHSATAQFFINVSNNAFLNFKSADANGYGYCVFGKVIDGKEVIDKIKKVKTGNHGMHQDVPTEQVIIEKAEIV